MKTKTLLWLVAALAVTGALAWMKAREHRAASPHRTGQPLLEDFDPNLLGRVQLTSGTQTVVLARGPSGWQVESRWHYPADFNRLARFLRDLAGLKVGEVLRGGTGHLDEFGLATAAANQATNLPAELRLQDRNGREVAYLVLGQPRAIVRAEDFNPPDSQYVRLNDGPVLLVAPYLPDLPRPPEEWMDRLVMDIPAERVTSMKAMLQDGTRYRVRRQDGQLTGEDGLAGRPLNSYGVDQWFSSWQGLTARTILDPGSDRAALGLENGDVVEAQTEDGARIKVVLGHQDEAGNRPALFTVNWEAPALPDGLDGEARAAAEQQQQTAGEQAVTLQKRVAPWIYQLTASAAQQLTLLQDQMVAADPATNAAPATPAPQP